MREEWRAINEWPDYQVSNCGRVKRVRRAPQTWIGRFLTPAADNEGYSHVTLSHRGKYRSCLVHCLVANAFLGQRLGREVNHKDGNRAHNIYSNLEYVTHRENVHHAIRNGRFPFGERAGSAKLTTRDVLLIRMLHAHGTSIIELSRKYSMDRGHISDIIHKKWWKHI